jgi:hypothetical protein
MDKDTTKKAIEKVHNIVQKIGYPTKSPDIMNPAALSDYYKSVNITSNFFQNHLAVNSFSVQFEWSALGKPVDRDQWGMTVPTVNAYYNPPGQEIVFPAVSYVSGRSVCIHDIKADIIQFPGYHAATRFRRGSTCVHVLRRVWLGSGS